LLLKSGFPTGLRSPFSIGMPYGRGDKVDNCDVEKLYKDKRFQARLHKLCRSFFAGNEGFWRIGSMHVTALEAKDLESAAWEKIVLIPPEKIKRDGSGAPVQSYLLWAVRNDFISQLRVAGRRWKIMPEADYPTDNETPAFRRNMQARSTTVPSDDKGDEQEGRARQRADLKKLHKRNA
jgi:DNA-directed RNA polymerase specialized sigma24 family protein